ncbi:MAG: LysM peptidoglycan-binding domain-containing protein [Muribaculaceae bacterium]|nr:LysM peptidoglycan-binding domain-containing protein [Muribaculaceae bacterium]
MKSIRTQVLLAIMALLCPLLAEAQLNLPIKTIGDESFYFYKTGNNESIQSIAQKLGVTVDQIITYNPSAKLGIAKKQLLFFPVSAFSNQPQGQKSTASVGNEPVTHVVKKGESLYGLARSYNMTIDELVEANPQANNGVQEGDVLMIPQKTTVAPIASAPVVADEPQVEVKTIFHTIKSGETLFGVAKHYNTTIENLIALNPGIYPDKFVEGDVIKVQPNVTGTITIEKDITKFYTYEVKDGDTYESVATAKGVTATALRQANPDMKKLKKGKTIYIPQSGVETAEISSSKATEKELEQTYANKMSDVYNTVHKIDTDNELNIGIILPFQLQKSNPPRQALLYTDFYKGFLVAVDSIGSKVNKKVNINVYDTQHNLNVTDSLLALDELKNLDIAIAPSEPKQLERINRFGQQNGVTVINCFSTKNDDYAENPRVVQMNTPTVYMVSLVNDWIAKNFKDYTVVYLDESNSEDKEIFASIKDFVKKKNIRSKTINVNDKLEFGRLSHEMDPGMNYLFIPSSGRKDLVNKYIGALSTAKSQRFDCEIALLGYPEYVSYLNDFKSSFQAVDTYIFSRFFKDDSRGQRIEQKFNKMFGDKMLSTTPSMGILGFDMGMYLLQSLNESPEIKESTPAYKGVQMTFDLMRQSNWSGLINKGIKMLHLKGSSMKETMIQ